jgi:hypothetical protein
MRWWWITLVLLACVKQPPRPREHVPITNLRATLARANIKLRLTDETLETAGCRPDPPPETRTCTRCEPVGSAGVNSAVLEDMTKALARYPASALSAAQIDHVAVCGEVVMRNQGEVYHPTAVADPYGRGVLVDVSRVQNPLLPWYDQIMGSSPVDEVLHHEIYHLLEDAHTPALMIEDTEWDALNLLGFHYTSANHDEGLIPGFINTYAMTRVSEDKAIVYGRLMSNPRYLCELAQDDEVLRAKVALVRRRVKSMMGTDDFLAPPCAATRAEG